MLFMPGPSRGVGPLATDAARRAGASRQFVFCVVEATSNFSRFSGLFRSNKLDSNDATVQSEVL